MAVAGGAGAPTAPPAGRGGLWGAITDVPGVAVGHAQRVGEGWRSGVSVVLPPAGTIGAVDVRGGGPGTRETDALDPSTLVPTVDAVCLAGGSAYGLAAADGVMAWCEQQGLGFPVGPPDDRRALIVPIVPAAVIFDLGRGGDPRARPGADLGGQAAAATRVDGAPIRGSIGAGTGAVMAGTGLKGGVGTASVLVRVPAVGPPAGEAPSGHAGPTPSGYDGTTGEVSVVVGALAVVNAYGSPMDRVTGRLYGAAFVPAGLPGFPAAGRRGPEHDRGEAGPAGHRGFATTLAVVATNAKLDVAAARRAAGAGHDGMARALSPIHTLLDGDTVFALATGEIPVDLEGVRAVQAAFADAVLLAVLDAVLAADAVHSPALDLPGYLDLPAITEG